MHKALRFCAYSGCKNIAVSGRYCAVHKDIGEAEEQAKKEQYRRDSDRKRGSATERGYDNQWRLFRALYLAKPENKFCRLHLRGCTGYADCIDHIIPLAEGGSKYDLSNLQPACLHCNTLKGRTTVRGGFVFGSDYVDDGQDAMK